MNSKVNNDIKKVGLIALLLLAVGCSTKKANSEHRKQETKTVLQQMQNLHSIKTAQLPESLKQTQQNYLSLENYVESNRLIVDSLIRTNAKLYNDARAEYALRIGKKFQLQQYFSPTEIQQLKNMIQNKTNQMSDVEKAAAQRIINKTASLQDLCTLCMYLNYDYIYNHFNNKIYLANWLLTDNNLNFIPADTYIFDNYSTLGEGLPIKFSDTRTNQSFISQTDSLMGAWAEDYAQILYNLVAKKTNSQPSTVVGRFSRENGGLNLPNFSIPEMKKIKTEYIANKKRIDTFSEKQNLMFNVQDSLRKHIFTQRKILQQRLDSLSKVK